MIVVRLAGYSHFETWDKEMTNETIKPLAREGLQARDEVQRKIYRHILIGCSDYSLWAIIRLIENGQADMADVEMVGGELLAALVEHKRAERERDQTKT